MEDIMLKAQEYLLSYGLNFIAAILIFVIGKWVAGVISRFIESMMIKGKADKTLAGFVRNLSSMAILVFVIIAALNKLGVETTSMVAVIGAAGLAIGLALQGSLANFAAGVILIIFKPFKTGDLIEAGGALGIVQEVQIFNTLLNTVDNRLVIIPNAKVTGDNIINFTSLPKRRVDLVFGISYSDDMKLAKDALLKVATSDPRVLKDPAPVVAVSELGDSSVNLVCRPWVAPADYWGVYFDVIEKGKLALETAGCTIPFPQNDVHFYQEKK
ncbi:MAG: mechanosensitive ion channel [Candidatus Aceula meridiana]|nr:mechanosensitive ion channel [Candidatus Aceula meridiana]